MEVSNPRDDRAERNLGGASVPLSTVIPWVGNFHLEQNPVISVTLHYCMSLIGNARNVMSYSCTGNVSNLYRHVAMIYHCLNVFR